MVSISSENDSWVFTKTLRVKKFTDDPFGDFKAFHAAKEIDVAIADKMVKEGIMSESKYNELLRDIKELRDWAEDIKNEEKYRKKISEVIG